MDSIQFLNNLAETKAKYNLGAGVPPLELYPQLFPDELMTLFVKETGADLMPYHRTAGILGEFARTTILLNEESTQTLGYRFALGGDFLRFFCF